MKSIPDEHRRHRYVQDENSLHTRDEITKAKLLKNKRLFLKTCSKCKNTLDIKMFLKNSASIDGLRPSCKVCDSPIRAKWRNTNRARIRRVTNEYRLSDKKRTVEYAVKSNRKLRDRSTKHKTMHSIRGSIHRAILSNYKTGKSIDILGCSIEYYKKFIESQFTMGMCWENRGKLWEIDHIIPIKSFHLEDIESIKLAFNFKNTQPILKDAHKIKTKIDNEQMLIVQQQR